MVRGAWIMVVVAAACSEPRRGLVGVGDAGSGDAGSIDAPPDAAVDAPPPEPEDPESTDLAVICGGKAPVTLDEWEDCYRKRECERAVRCIDAINFRDVADCVAHWDELDGGRRAAGRRERARAVAMQHAAIAAPAFAQCLIQTSVLRCIDPAWDAACATRFTGAIADGDACFADVDCASPGATCATACPDACCEGVCQPKLVEGAACAELTECQPGLQCDGDACISGNVDTPCDDVLQCDFELWCDAKAHRCKAKRAFGAECTDILQCPGNGTCLGLSISSSQPGTCVRNSHVGDRCDDSCHGNLVCGRDGLCHALPALGQACAATVPCGGTDAICERGTCVPRGEVGARCSGQTCLPSLFCTSELGASMPACAARGGTGAPCRDPGHCESYRCSGSRAQPGVCLAWLPTCP